MKETLEKIYWCDYCNRPMMGKGAMSRHEKFCRENPNNKHQCFKYCKHLYKSHHLIETGDYNDMPRVTDMMCLKNNIKMYSFKFEKNVNKPQNALDGLIRMPLNCEHYECEDGHDFN